MNFFSNIFLTIATFFGFGQVDMEAEVQPVPIIEEINAESDILSPDTQTEESGPVENIDDSGSSDPGESGVISLNTQPDEAEYTEGESMEVNAGGGEISAPSAVLSPDLRTMVVAGGCFWCVEADLEKVHGVIEVVSGYAGGSTDNPTYKTYGSGGHREVVEVTYDANQVSFEDILIVTMKTTDPTDDDGTFADRGDKYSSAFYYDNDEQKQIIENLIKEVDKHGPYDKPLAIDIEKRPTFWPAEDSHQDYYKGTLTHLKYQYYRNASGRSDFIVKYWGVNDHSPKLPWRSEQANIKTYMWSSYQKPNVDVLEGQLDPLVFKVTQKEGTEKAGSSPLDKNWEEGIYVDILSGEPLYSSKDKFDSGTGWPSFVRPITPDAVTEHIDKRLFTSRTEIRSAIADNHLGHVFNDGPKDSTGFRYCMNGVALKFIPKVEMEVQGYGDFLKYI